MTGAELTTFITNLNGGAPIDDTLLTVLVNTAKTILEEERPWMVLRKTDSSLSLTGAETWQTAKSLSGITDLSQLFDDGIIRLFDGDNRIQYYIQRPFDRRLEYKDVSDSFVFDENAGNLYFGGTAPFAGTLYIHYITTSDEIDLASTSAVWSLFPSRFLPLLGFYAIGIHKGAVDYDDINRQMLPENRAVMTALKNAMEAWDNKRQLAAIANNDPTDFNNYPRAGAIDTRS